MVLDNKQIRGTDLDNRKRTGMVLDNRKRIFDEVKALPVFQAFHREAWLINDSILLGALVELEKEIEKKELIELVQLRKTKDCDADEESYEYQH